MSLSHHLNSIEDKNNGAFDPLTNYDGYIPYTSLISDSLQFCPLLHMLGKVDVLLQRTIVFLSSALRNYNEPVCSPA